MSSAAEREIREAVEHRLRELMPEGRIIHELNVAGQGSNRIDIASVGKRSIVAVEIKSERDTLKRLDDQWVAFGKCCHKVIVAAHMKHFISVDSRYHPSIRLNHPIFLNGLGSLSDDVWRFPRPPEIKGSFSWQKPWTFDPVKGLKRQPAATDMLAMLWAEELRDECARHDLDSSSRRTRWAMILDMTWNMTGGEVCEAVCRQLRQRQFGAADPPIAGA